MSEVKWFKLSNDFFENRKIKLIQREKNGDRTIVVWLYILCLSSKINDNGLVYVTKKMPYSSNALAIEIGYKKNVIKDALETLEKYEMISVDGDFIQVLNWEKHQNAQSLERIRNQTNERVKRHREKMKSNKEETQQEPLHETLQETLPSQEKEERRKKREDKDKKNEKKKTYSDLVAEYTDDEDLRKTLLEFVNMRKAMKGFTLHALELKLLDLDKLAVDVSTKTEIVNQTIANSWKGFFALKTKKQEQEVLPF